MSKKKKGEKASGGKDKNKKRSPVPHRLESLNPMCIPQSNMTQNSSSSVTSTQERPTSCPAPRQRTLMAGEEEEAVIFLSVVEVEVEDVFFFWGGPAGRRAREPATIDTLRRALFLSLSVSVSIDLIRPAGYRSDSDLDALMRRERSPSARARARARERQRKME